MRWALLSETSGSRCSAPTRRMNLEVSVTPRRLIAGKGSLFFDPFGDLPDQLPAEAQTDHDFLSRSATSPRRDPENGSHRVREKERQVSRLHQGPPDLWWLGCAGKRSWAGEGSPSPRRSQPIQEGQRQGVRFPQDVQPVRGLWAEENPDYLIPDPLRGRSSDGFCHRGDRLQRLSLNSEFKLSGNSNSPHEPERIFAKSFFRADHSSYDPSCKVFLPPQGSMTTALLIS